MAWSKRAPERIYAVIMWIVSLVLAGFLIGFGGLLIGDLPRVAAPTTIERFIDADAAEDAARAEQEARDQLGAIGATLRTARDDLATARGNYQSAYETFQNWVAARRSTADPAQDPEVISRTNVLDILKEREREAERAVEQITIEERRARDALDAVAQRQAALQAAARPAYERARAMQELRIFLFRLALTLPLLVIAFWLTAKQRKSRYWPLMRGFVVFAAFAFFVELVPYLPSYGGYVRYGVGVLLTIVVGFYVIKWMRRYLESRRDAERLSEDQRRKSVAYEDALKKLGDKVCPGCDRKVLSTGDVEADYCVHCGMHLYDRCASCDTRKASFYKYCMVCGENAGAAAASA